MVTTDHSHADSAHLSARVAQVPSTWSDAPSLVPSGQGRRLAPLVLWLGCLAVAIVLLLLLGGGRLAAPALTAPGTWMDWAAGRDPVEVAGVVLRLFALGLAWYLVGVTGVSVLARVLRAARLVRLADALAVGPVRSVVQQAVGISLATGVLVTSVPGVTPATVVAMPTDAAASTVTAAPVAADPAPVTPSTVVFGGAGEELAPADTALDGPPVPAPAAPVAPVLTPSSDAPAPAPTPSSDATVPSSAAPAPTPSTAPPAPSGPASQQLRQVRVAPGDHLWSLAEQDVAGVLARPPTEAEVATHWRRVVAANADHLQVPGNPDFLVPGQHVVLPPVQLEDAS